MHQYKRWAIFTAALFLSISAALVSGPHLYYMAGMLLMLPLISYGLGMVTLRGLEVRREAPPSGWDGETVTFHAVVQSHSRVARLFLQAEDLLPEHLEIEEPAPLFNALPNAVTRIPYRVRLAKRGAYRLEWIRLTALDPLGMFAFPQRYRCPGEFLVYPIPETIPDIVMTGAERFGYRDLPFAAVRGSGVDPDGVREYVPGDPLRRMHWKSTARTGRLSVIEFEESRAVNIVLALDLYSGAHAGQGRESTLEYLIRMAASLAQMAVRQGASARLVAGETVDGAEFGRGSEQLYAILGGLARAEARDPDPLSATLNARVGSLQAGATLIALTAGADTGLPGALAEYTRKGAHVVTVYADPRSFEPDVRLPTRDAQRRVLSDLAGAQTDLYLLCSRPGEALQPEPYEYGNHSLS